MVRKYADPPLQEAFAEVRFRRPERWDLTLPGLIYQALDGEHKFPHKEQERVLARSSLTLGPSSVQHSSELIDRVKFLTEDKKTIIQLGSDLLSVHRLRPYESWESFSPVIKEALSVYLGYAKPEALVALKLQYWDVFDIPCGIGEIAQYLNLSPHAEPKLTESEQFDTFITGICSRHENRRDSLRIELVTTAQSEPTVLHLGLVSCYVLDRMDDFILGSSEIMTWLEVAHRNVSRAFESCITDCTRALFGEVS